MNASVNCWVDKGTISKTNLSSAAKLITWTFRLEFCRQFYKDKHRWPVLHIGSLTPSKITYNYKNNIWEESPVSPWRAEDFQHIYFEKSLDFDYHVDIADLLSDKSIIPGLTHWIHEYDRQAHRTLYGRFPTGPPPESKSVIIHYLKKVY